jgi:Trypsin-like peptidase domain
MHNCVNDRIEADVATNERDITDLATQALEEAVRKSTVGIVSGSGKHQFAGLGTGTLVVWKGRHLLLTADHVIGRTNLDDLRFFLPSDTQPIRVERENLSALSKGPSVTRQPFVGLPFRDVTRNEDLDLASMVVEPDLGGNKSAIFFQLTPGGATPVEGRDILSTGYPHDITQSVAPGEVAAVGHTEWTKVLGHREGLKNFDPDKHFLGSYLTETDYPGANPTGLSGAAVWSWKEKGKPGLWYPDLELSGVMSAYYGPSRLLKMVRREVVEQFLSTDE